MSEIISNDRITCEIDGVKCHSIQLHLKSYWPDWTIERYQKEYPTAPIISDLVASKKRERDAIKKIETANAIVEGARKALHIVFGLGNVPAAMNAHKLPIMIETIETNEPEEQLLVPDIDPNYIFNIDLMKNMMIGFTMRTPIYFWGYHGTGKTTAFEQAAARLNWPFMRVQHTVNTEESHIVGQWIVKDGETQFQLGPLAVAMIKGQIYAADEYDYAMPSVLSVYQPVLEGKALVIKEAPAHLRVIKPHRNFRFVATGNTNGGGDETGLYQGTQIQNAANYSRFGVVEEVRYMDETTEISVIAGQSGIEQKDAKKFVEFAAEVRKSFAAGRIGSVVSPRELINAAKIGLLKGGDWKAGMKLAFTNRLNRVDMEVISQFAQRFFG